MPRRPPRAPPERNSLAALRRLGAVTAAAGEGGDPTPGTLELVVRDLGCSGAALLLVAPEGGMRLAAQAGWAGEEPGRHEFDSLAAARAARAGSTVVVAGGQTLVEGEVEAAAGRPGGGPVRVLAPVRSPVRVLGVLEAEVGGGAPREAVIALQTVADHLGLALYGRELQGGNLAKMHQLLALQRVGRAMTAGGELSELLRMVAEEALQLTAADGGALYLLAEADPDHLALQAWSGKLPPGRERVPLGYGIVGWVGRSGTPLRASDRGAGGPEAEYASRRSQLAVPLVSEGRVLGVLAVECRREEAFSATDEELLALFAAQAAKAIHAARLLGQLREERDLRDQILGGTPNGVVALDAGRRVVLMNPAARRFLGVEEAPEGNPVERYLMAPAFLEELGRVLAGESARESLEFAAPAAGGNRHLLANVFPVGPRRGVTVILQDLTERRKLDDRVQRLSRLASIGQLAAGIAHEIRNPLTGVAISLDILREDGGLGGEGRSLLDDINREIDRLEALIRGLLAFARPQPAEVRPMRIAKALDWHRTFREQCRKKGVHFRLELRDNPKVEGDPEKLMQLFLNLAINALDAAPAGGEIRVWTERLAGRPHPWARVAVEDTGEGMDEETVSQIFNPFFTTKNEGTGLGLSIAHSIVEQHGGRIDVQSRLGSGTRFTVDLPALEEG